jgi:hypothetical protein
MIPIANNETEMPIPALAPALSPASELSNSGVLDDVAVGGGDTEAVAELREVLKVDWLSVTLAVTVTTAVVATPTILVSSNQVVGTPLVEVQVRSPLISIFSPAPLLLLYVSDGRQYAGQTCRVELIL